MDLSVWFLFCSPLPWLLCEAETMYDVKKPDVWDGIHMGLDMCFKAKFQAQAHSADHLLAGMQTCYFFG